MAQKVRKDDTVQVFRGKDRGKQGKVQRILSSEGRVVVEGVNILKRHVKRRPGLRQAGIISLEVPIRLSHVRVVCPRCNRPARMGFQVLEDRRKVRVCKKCKEAIE